MPGASAAPAPVAAEPAPAAPDTKDKELDLEKKLALEKTLSEN